MPTMSDTWNVFRVRRQLHILVALFLGFSLFITPVLSLPSTALAQDSAQATLAPPETGAQAVYAVDVTIGQPLYDLNSEEQRSPASLTKMATVLVVTQFSDLDEEVEIVDSDLATEDESQVGFVTGDRVTMEQLLYGMLLPSGNDAARAAARATGAKIGGVDPTSPDATDIFMNQVGELVADLGLKNTQFMNPVGLDEQGHYSTARDLSVLASEVMKNDLLHQIVALPTYQLDIQGPQARTVELTNTNKLIGVDSRVLGVKTGSHDVAGGCLVVAVNEGGNEVVVVELGNATPQYDELGNTTFDPRFDDMETILDQLEKDFIWIQPTAEQQIAGLPDAMAAWQVGLKDGPAIAVPRSSADDLEFRMRLGPAAQPGDEVGHLLFYLGDIQIGEWMLYQAPV
jgi:serine-type D-Ala-D-Ala carboxypeptidase (penicillin-binding protein 5/6)